MLAHRKRNPEHVQIVPLNVKLRIGDPIDWYNL